MLAGIMKADRAGGLFRATMKTLEALSAAEVHCKAGIDMQIPQAHALNCARDLFLDSQLSQCMQEYVATFLERAADSLESIM